MTTLSDKVLLSFEKNLSDALVRFSHGKVSDEKAKKIAEIAIKNIDFENPFFNHKGINWYAKELLDIVDLEKIA